MNNNKISRSEQIAYLISRKFPVNYISREKRLVFQVQIKPEMKTEISNQIKVYQGELTQMSANELDNLYIDARKQEKESHEKWLQKQEELREQRHLFNQPDASTIDWEYWSKAAYWTIDEAIAISLGKDPKKVSWEKIKGYKNRSSFVQEYEKRGTLLSRALEGVEIPCKHPYSDSPIQIKKEDLIKWMKKNELKFPKELNNYMPLLQKNKVPYEKLNQKLNEVKKELKALRRNHTDLKNTIETKNKIILAVAMKKYNYKPNSSKNIAANRIAGETELYKIPVSEGTILNHLKEAKSLLSLSNEELYDENS